MAWQAGLSGTVSCCASSPPQEMRQSRRTCLCLRALCLSLLSPRRQVACMPGQAGWFTQGMLGQAWLNTGRRGKQKKKKLLSGQAGREAGEAGRVGIWHGQWMAWGTGLSQKEQAGMAFLCASCLPLPLSLSLLQKKKKEDSHCTPLSNLLFLLSQKQSLSSRKTLLSRSSMALKRKGREA